MTQLILFDVDGTLAQKYVNTLLPGVEEFFTQFFRLSPEQRPRLALITNQGGVGMRYYLQQTRPRAAFRYPSEHDVMTRLQALTTLLTQQAAQPVEIPIYVCFRYLDRRGTWTPAPPDTQDNPRWSQAWRKPAPGMLLQAIQDAGAASETTLMVGDSPDDQNAAAAAACSFCWAEDFFSKPFPNWGE